MKICFITSTIFNLGGVQRVLSVVASELSKFHDVDILCTDNSYEINRELYDLELGVNVIFGQDLIKKNFFQKALYGVIKKINFKTGFLNNKKNINTLTEIYYPKKIQDKFIDYLNKKNYDIVIGVEGIYSLLLGIISDKLNSKTIGWQHNCYEAYLKNEGRYYWNQNELFNKYIPNLDEYIVLTKNDQEMFLKENNIDCKVIYNPKSFSSAKKSKLEKKQFLAAGRFTYQKGFDLLIESFNEFSKINSEWNLVIVGEGDEKEQINELIKKYNLFDRIRIDDFTDDIKKYFCESSILLLPSRWEGMPMIVLESLEMGVPVISYDIPAIQPLITNNKEGLIVEKFNTRNFALAMNILAKDSKKLREFACNAITKSEEFSLDSIVSRWNYIFEEMLKNK